MSNTRDFSADARSAKADRLDAAIDAVARRMVEVRDDADLATRIAGALPGRRWRFTWLIPPLAAAGALAIAVWLWTPRDRATAPPLPAASTGEIAEMRARIEPVEPVEPLEPGTEPLEPLEPLEPASSDHERSLAPVAVPVELALSTVTPRELPAMAPLTLEPLEIGELPLTAETFSPREF